MKNWTLEEEAIIRKFYPNSTIKELSLFLPNRTWRAIYQRANLLGLGKNYDFLKSEKCGRFYAGHNQSKSTQFKPGHIAWNKGKKGLNLGGEKGHFKKGHMPHNTKEDGTISIRVHKGTAYKYIRVAMGLWRQLHTYTWEQANNTKLPKGHIVVFKDGDTMNCELSNLEMISCAENMLRNTIHRYPSEVKDSIRLLNKLNKKISEHEKQTC